MVRINLLSKALPLVMDLLTKITMGDPSVTLNALGDPKVTTPGIEATKRAAYSSLDIYPHTYDWLNDPSDKHAYVEITNAARLISENLARPRYRMVVMDGPPGGKVDFCAPGAPARNDGAWIVLWPTFFVCRDAPRSSQCPGIILLHEYFHRLAVNPTAPPSQRTFVYHGGPGCQDASNLEHFSVHVALGSLLECACPPPPKQTGQ